MFCSLMKFRIFFIFILLFAADKMMGLKFSAIDDYQLKWSFQAPAEIKWLDHWEDGYAAGDLNNDGYADVAIGTIGGTVIIVNGFNGNELWHYQLPETVEYVNVDIVDLDGDGVLDVIAGGKVTCDNVRIYAFNGNGTMKWDNPATGDYCEVTDFAYGDINGDGHKDIAASIGKYSHGGGEVVLFDGRDGSRIWKTNLGRGIAFGIDAKDMNNDGDMEVAVTSYDNKVYLIDGATNTIHWSRSGSYYGRDVIIADVDNDGAFEITSVMGNTYCYNEDGSYAWINTTGVGENLTRCNPDNNELSELLIVNPWVGNCSLVQGANGEILWTRDEAGAADVGDVNGDGIDEFIMTSMKWYEPDFPKQYLRIVNCQNNLLWETEFDTEASALVAANIDKDVNDEILLTSNDLLIALDIELETGMNRDQAIPSHSRMFQNYPNPFNPLTTIEYTLRQNSNVELIIYDILGNPVITLVDAKQTAGTFKLLWNSRDEEGVAVPTGVYFGRLKTDSFTRTIKLLYVK